MITKFDLFEGKRGRPKNKYIVCVKDFHAYVYNRVLKSNGKEYDYEYHKSKYLLFKEGERYSYEGPDISDDGKYFFYINSKLKYDHNNQWFDKKFHEPYENVKFNDFIIDEFFEIPEDMKKEREQRNKVRDFNL